MQNSVTILIVEDNMIIGAKISVLLESLGYQVAGLIPRAEDALLFLKENTPDILLLDIKLRGEMDGIELAKAIQLKQNIPIIFLTSNTDEATFNRAKKTSPYAFISKPYKKLDLQRAIELTLRLMANAQGTSDKNSSDMVSPFILNDRIFVRHKERMVKIFFQDILYIEAERNYARIFTKEKEYLLSITLKIIEEKLQNNHFLRVHRSYIINLLQLDEVGERFIIIGKKTIPYSAAQKEELMKRLKKL